MKWKYILGGLLIMGIVGAIAAYVVGFRIDFRTRTEVNPQPPRVELELTDDRLEDKNPAFDPELVDSRPLEDWDVNKSAAVIKLECPSIRTDIDSELLELRPSYREALQAAREHHHELLPSANLIDGAAKQFDDGLYAALDLACYRGEIGPGVAAPSFIQEVFDQFPQDSPARPFLAAALELAGLDNSLTPEEERRKRRILTDFDSNKAISKPISFYDWNDELKCVWRFFRFLQFEFAEVAMGTAKIPRAMASILEANPGLLNQYRAFNEFYGHLTNPQISLSLDKLIGTDESLGQLAQRYGTYHESVAVFPPSTSREAELFEALFGFYLPPDVNLMGELMKRIRSGEVDLAPGGADGWYQYQLYALETMLLPSMGHEKDKLLLMASYKKRLVEAFKALVTKRRETHVRQLAVPLDEATAVPPQQVEPRLRAEPCPTFYLRTARAYAFLQNFLLATVEEETLLGMRGLKKGGYRELNLAAELDEIRRRFYGFYLVSCEDIGMRPQLLQDEPVDEDAAKQAALSWLGSLGDNPDLVRDTRAAIPIFISRVRNRTRLWIFLGVRLARLDASYARAPSIRPKGATTEWLDATAYGLATARYVIPVDEFAEIEIDKSNAPTRTELRAICDKHKTREEIVKALAQL